MDEKGELNQSKTKNMRLVIILLIINVLLSSCMAENETETFSPIGEDKNELGLTDSFVQTAINYCFVINNLHTRTEKA